MMRQLQALQQAKEWQFCTYYCYPTAWQYIIGAGTANNNVGITAGTFTPIPVQHTGIHGWAQQQP